MKLSVVVLFAQGRAAVPLERALASVSAQSRPADEIVLVLNGAQIPMSVAATHPELQLVHLRNNIGCPAGRNAGAKAASGDVLVFVDDDGRLDLGALAAVEVAFDRWPCNTAFAGRVVDPFSVGTRREPIRDGAETMHFSGGVFAISRPTFLNCGGYCEYSLRQGEELDLALKLFKQGVKVRRLPALVLFHPAHPRAWTSEEALLGTANAVRVFWTRLPLSAAVAGTFWKLAGHASRLVRARRTDLLLELLSATLRAAGAGVRERDALGWREYRAAFRLIHAGAISVVSSAASR